MPLVVKVPETIALVAGAVLVAITLSAAIQTFVLPRSANVLLSRIVFNPLRALFTFRTRRADSYEKRDRIMALYAPVALIGLTAFWIALIVVGYTAMFWAAGIRPLAAAIILSGSSLFTLGFATVDTLALNLLIFSEAAIGLGLVALLVAYLPTMYTAFSRREKAVTMLEVRAGSPPTATEWIKRAQRLGRLTAVGESMEEWETWFAELEESHTSLASLVFFRSPRSERSWVTAAGAVLDTAALMASTVDVPRDVRHDLCIRAGYLALRYIADYFDVEYNADPSPDAPISIARVEFDSACDELVAAGVPLRADRDEAWRHFQGWRVNYDTVLLALAALTMAPYAPWSSDRSIWRNPSLLQRLKRGRRNN